jgi:hypothetical protein
MAIDAIAVLISILAQACKSPGVLILKEYATVKISRKYLIKYIFFFLVN